MVWPFHVHTYEDTSKLDDHSVLWAYTQCRSSFVNTPLEIFYSYFAMENPKFSSVLEFWECILNIFAFRDSYAGIHTPAVQKFTRGGASL